MPAPYRPQALTKYEHVMNDIEALKCTIFMTKAGSHAYGTSTPDSDIDWRGVCLPPSRELYIGLGSHSFEQKEKWEDKSDKVVYDFRKALKLMAEGNPNMLDLAFTPDIFWVICSPIWQEIIDNRHLFLSRKMRYTFGGYAFSQLKRIRNHRAYLLNPPTKRPERSDYGLKDGHKLLSQDHMASFQGLIAHLLRERIHLMDFSESTKEELMRSDLKGVLSSNVGNLAGEEQTLKELTGAPDYFISVFTKEKQYAHAVNQWNAYNNWKEKRNPKRAALEAKMGFDGKHAMHLIRLLRMGVEIMTEGKVNVYRHEDREELLEIRNGAWPYEKVEEFANAADKQLQELYNSDKCPVPRSVNINAIEHLCMKTIEKHVFNA